MAEPDTALQKLARAHGIAATYVDVFDRTHRVGDDTLRTLLAAMQVPAASDAEVDAAHAALADARWRHPLPPLTVLRTQARPWQLTVHLPRQAASAALAWRLVDERGAVRVHAIDRARIATAAEAERDGAPHVALVIELAAELAPGYYRIALASDEDIVCEAALAVAPPRCYRPPALATGHRAWGAAVQLYGLRSQRNFGIGDFSDLAALAAGLAKAGADVVGVNPLHALFPHDPARASPYSPSSRLFVNPLYLDVAAIPELRWSPQARAVLGSDAFRDELARLRAADLVDYRAVAAAKERVLGLIYADARRARAAQARERWLEFEAFKAAGGESLRRHARFEALQEHLHAGDATLWGWPAWPPAYRDPDSEAVAQFAQAHAERVEYFAWLQWQCTQQRAAVAARARRAGMTVGLYTDLAVSVDRGGAETWSAQSLYAVAASVGAPPDAFNVNGQNWGLPPIVPARLAAAGYAPFIATLRATMRDAGALRIDHAMALYRLFWVPPDAQPAQGAYVHYPFADLLGLLALESHRHRCAVIGEDLGTVPEEVRVAFAANDILSYRVLMFERTSGGGFAAPAAYPEPALATATTHDLPTLAGWWEGHDIRLRARHGLLGHAPDVDGELAGRAEERKQLVAALVREGLVDAAATAEANASALPPALALAVQRYLARAPSALMAVQPEDVLGLREPANLPGTTNQHPNWRRRLPVAVEAFVADPRFTTLAAQLARERPRTRADTTGSARRRALPAPTRRPPPAVALPLAAIPRSTYRLQLHRAFTFRDVAALVPYFAALGVSHLYLSPYLRARPGSQHGYDVVDHQALNPEIGTRADFDALVATLAAHGMQHLCDVVPNHMAVLGADNAWWMDVLQHGQASAYAAHFDIDWDPPDASLRGKVLVPVLGVPYGTALEQGDLRLDFEAASGTFAVRYFEHRLPLDPRTYPDVLAHLRADEPQVAAVQALAEAWRALPERNDSDEARRRERRERAAVLAGGLAQLVAASPALAAAMAQAVARLNGTPGSPASFDALDALLDRQAWRVAFWRVAGDEINYRRFFDINELAGLRTDRDEVFEATHDFLLDLAAGGSIGGLRIDHPDGLRDPARYFQRLQERFRAKARRADDGGGLYVVVEKICAPHEPLHAAWPVHGDTGYVFATAVTGVLVDPTAQARIDRLWRAFVGDEADDFATTAYAAKRAILAGPLAAALTTLTGRALAIARSNRHTRDYTFSLLRRALAEIAAHFPVYRTYVSPRGHDEADRRYLDWAIARARRTAGIADPLVFDFLHALLLGAVPPGTEATLAAARVAFALAFQQLTAPAAAKGVEDTAFYRHTRLVALNEVGSDPSHFGLTRRAFHRAMAERAQRWPHALSATSTHDNKRAEDVRARLAVVSERPQAWRAAVRRWSQWNRSRKREVDGAPAPSRNDEYLLYQTLVGTLPVPAHFDPATLDAYRERIRAYAVKAAREAKRHTSWTAVNEAYEEALTGFVDALLAARGDNRFLADLRERAAEFAWWGRFNSLTMALLKFAAPGVADLYQGNECIDLSLVDPDNRRRVDFTARARAIDALRALERLPVTDRQQRLRALNTADDGSDAKLWLTLRGLAFRNEHAALTACGDYVPLASHGLHARHVLAFARRHEAQTMIAVAGRLYASLGLPCGTAPLGDRAWGEDALDVGFLADGTLLDDAVSGASLRVAGGRLPLAAVLASFPAALLTIRG